MFVTTSLAQPDYCALSTPTAQCVAAVKWQAIAAHVSLDRRYDVGVCRKIGRLFTHFYQEVRVAGGNSRRLLLAPAGRGHLSGYYLSGLEAQERSYRTRARCPG